MTYPNRMTPWHGATILKRFGAPGLPFSARRKRKRVHRSTWPKDRCKSQWGRVAPLLVVEYPIMSLYKLISDVDNKSSYN